MDNIKGIHSFSLPDVCVIIPARGGSKGLPRKNIIPLAGKPLIAHTIEYALACDKVNRVVVSTDDAEIADISRYYGAEVPFLRPKHLAKDKIPPGPAIDALSKALYPTSEEQPVIITLYPTSPFRPPWLLSDMLQAISAGFKSVICVRAVDIDINSIIIPDSSGNLKPLFSCEKVENTKRTLYRPYGLGSANYENNACGVYLLKIENPVYFIDIDTHGDLVLAENYINSTLSPN